MNDIDFGLFYVDEEAMLFEAEGLEITLMPFEEKYFKFYIGGTSITSGSIITIDSYLDSLVSHSDVTLSLHNIESNTWKCCDIVTCGDNTLFPVRLKIRNNGYTELSSELVLNLTLQYLPDDQINFISYYGNLQDSKYKYLSKPPEPIPSRILEINVIPEGADYTKYLAYSHGSSLIILDDGSAIPYKEGE